jgi:hypothetical protein
MSIADPQSFSIPILVEESVGLRRQAEPVRLGIPFPRQAVFDPSELALFRSDLVPSAAQIEVLARWFDESIKWVLVDFQVDVQPNQVVEYLLRRLDAPLVVAHPAAIAIAESAESIEVNTGQTIFVIDSRKLRPFRHVYLNGVQVLEELSSEIRFTDENGQHYEPRIENIGVETRGPLRSTVRVKGQLRSPRGTAAAEFVSRLTFFAGSSVVEIEFTLRNSRAASHPGGLWDLGDEGSIQFQSLSIDVALSSNRVGSVLCLETLGQLPVQSDSPRFEIYQDSSGGEQWNSSNHVDRHGKTVCKFRGYRVAADGITVANGLRANPVVCIRGQHGQLAGAIEGFWQNFPKCIEVDDRLLRFGLFPRQFGSLYELQAGEQKTHTLYLSVGDTDNFERVLHKLSVRSTPAWYATAEAVSYLSPRHCSEGRTETVQALDSLVDTAVKGDNTFFHRRELIDEYGWRNFGDIYADHEAVGFTGDVPLVAHYNNQYDVIHGAIVQYLRSGDAPWFQLADEYARHVIDIDVYHTRGDRHAFNGGLFWHTQHYSDAATCTHRAYSKMHVGARSQHEVGGGPSSEHNYTTGLMEYYLLTGAPAARDTVLGLAEWVMNMDARSGGILGAIDRRPRGLCSMTVSWDYHGPGRGCANSVNALLDAYLLSREERYWLKAEELIRRSIHPKEDIERRNLGDVEHRWSYTVFLQVLGKYLDIKVERAQFDHMYAYARSSLLHYASWMCKHEVPYRSILDRVELPTETWPAQDIRKSNVFKFAAKYCDHSMRQVFADRSQFFFERCIRDLLEFETCGLTRPVVLLMTNGYLHPYFLSNPLEAVPRPAENHEFGEPRVFKPQFYELYRLREIVFKIRQALADVAGQIRNRWFRKERGLVSEEG